MSWSSEVGGTESGDGVGGSPEVRRDLGMACNMLGATMCYNKVVSASRDECGLHTTSTRLRVKLRVSRCSRGLGHARGLGSENIS